MDILEATYNKTIYEREDCGAAIALYDAEKCYIITGNMLPTTKKIKYRFKGEWVNHPKYGKQFKAFEYEALTPSDKEGLLEYLSSGVIKGIGKATAKKIVAAFGTETINVLENNIEKLLEVKGITEKRFEKIKKSFEENNEGRDAIFLLTKKGFSPRIASKVYQEFKKKTIDVIEKRPYLLCTVPGITFPQADALGSDTEEYEKDYNRFKICAYFALQENEVNGLKAIPGNRTAGSVSMEINDFGRCMLSLLNKGSYTKEEIRENTLKMIKEDCLNYINKDGKQYIYKSGILRIEKALAEDIIRLSRKETITEDIDRHIKDIEEGLDIKLGECQKEAIRNAFKNNLSLIVGPPGTGKTTIIEVIAYIYQKINGITAPMSFVALTGQAAHRIKESTGFEAQTIHSRLGITTETITDVEQKEEYKIENSLLVVDEISMLDLRTAYQLFSSTSSDCKVVLVGDEEQLQSVGAGAVLRDILESGVIPTTALNEIYRQHEGSRIYINSQKIRNNDTSLLFGEDFNLIDSPMEEIEDLIVERYIEDIKKYGINNVMLLSPFKEHTAGVKALNKKIQDKLHPADGNEFHYGSNIFRIGDMVMQLKNTEELVNGDIGTVIAIEKSDGMQSVTVKYEECERTYTDEEADEITLAYAYTVHKSQGNEKKAVILFLSSMHSVMLKKNVVYTAITRSKEVCTIMGAGCDGALKKAILTTDNSKRNTGLSMLLKDEAFWKRAAI